MVGQSNGRGRLYPDKDPQIYEACLPTLNNSNSPIHKRDINIPTKGATVTFSIEGEILFEFNKKYVKSYQSLVDLSLKQLRINFGFLCKKKLDGDEPIECVKKENRLNYLSYDQFSCERPKVIYLLNLDKNIGKNGISKKVWTKIWRDKYSFGCYSNSKFQLIKERLLQELNEYRKYHKTFPLVMNSEMSYKAQQHAEKFVAFGALILETSLEYEEIVTSTEIFNAPFIVKKWFEEFSKYNRYTMYFRKKFKNYEELFLRTTTHIGIGVAKKDCRLVFVFRIKRRQKKFSDVLPNFIKRKKIEHLSEIHPELVNKEVFIKVTECFNRKGQYIPKYNHLTYKACLPPLTRTNSKIEYRTSSFSVDGVTVTFAENGKKLMKCNRKTFSSLNEFTKCATNQRRVSFGRNCERAFNRSEPANCVSKKDKLDSVNKKSICEKPNTIYLLRLGENYKKSKFSNRIWAEIWSTNYNFECFSKNNYRLLRQRYLMEVNAYRGHHRAPPLFEDITMSHVAQRQAEEISTLGKVAPNSGIDYESPIDKKKVKLPENDVALTISVDGKASYECNNRRVPTLKELAQCAMKKRRVSFGPSCQKIFNENVLPKCINEKSVKDKSVRKPSCEEPNVMYLFNLDEKFRKNSFSNKVWSRIWQNKYDYTCFSYNNFYLLKQRYMLELNTYRSAHSAKPLIEHFELSERAQRRAEEIAESGKNFPRVDKCYEEVVGKSEILLAPFMVKKWYEEVSEYNFRNPFSKKMPQNFVKIIWKSTTYYGIGIAKRNCELIVVLMFKAKKRNSRRYFSNVKRSKIV
uniref:SCP domain-containing protein n=1 Tax=Strongyloides papillosus TaxID=174720 RepID=A0A0N5BV77_STREA